MERRLAAILVADLVGYTALMSADEAGTLQRLNVLRRVCLEPLIDRHHGRIVKLMGDGLLVEFSSVVDAVVCALAWQEAVTVEQREVEELRWMRFRIGINLGDVIVEGEDIYGEGVNIAARLEGLAEPGGICLSEDAYRHARGKVDAGFEDLGARKVKNLAEPLRVYRAVPKDAAAHSPVPSAETLPLPDRPSIAVLPFANMSNDPNQEYFSEGITEDIITELSRFREVFVIARNSSFAYKGQAINVGRIGEELGVQYVVEGSVRKAGGRIRVTAQLVEAANGKHLWAERYDRDLEDVFAVQDELAQAIVSVLPGRLQGTFLERAARKPPESLTAYEHLLLARWRWERNSADVQSVIAEFEKAIAQDPGLARAYVGLAQAFAYSVFARGQDSENCARLTRVYAEKALLSDDQDALVHAVAAVAYTISADHDRARFHSDRAIALNPNEVLAILSRAFVLTYGGEPDAGLEWFMKAWRLDPHGNRTYIESLVECHYMRRAYAEAVAVFKSWSEPPFSMYDVLAACYAQLGEIEAANEAHQFYLENKPEGYDDAVAHVAHMKMCRRKEDRDHWLEGFCKAGIVR